MTTVNLPEPKKSDMPKWARKHPAVDSLFRLWCDSLSGRIAITEATADMRKVTVIRADPTYYLRRDADSTELKLAEMDKNSPDAIDLRQKLSSIYHRIRQLEA